MNIVFLDLEFSKRKWNTVKFPFEIIEVGFIVTDLSGNIKDEYSQYIKVEDAERIDDKVLEITGIKKKDLKLNSVFFADFAARLRKIVESGCYFVCWSNMDKRVLLDNFEFRGLMFNKLKDSMYFDAQKAYSSIKGLKNPASLKNASIGSPLFTLQDHRAIYDCHKMLYVSKEIGVHNILSKEFLI